MNSIEGALHFAEHFLDALHIVGFAGLEAQRRFLLDEAPMFDVK